MKAILTYTTVIDSKTIELTRLFDTATAKKICDVENSFGKKIQEIYVTNKGVVFEHTVVGDARLSIPNQKEIKQWIGKNEPDKYIEFFGEVEEG